MKANSRFRSGALRRLCLVPGLILVVGGCAGGVAIPRRGSSPTPVARSPAPPPSAPAPVPTSADWRDLPQTAGDWAWSQEAADSVARFGEGLLILRCDRPHARIELRRAGNPAGSVPITVTTTTLSQPLMGEPVEGSAPAISASLPAGDPLLDAMAFSRGRFLLAATGLPTLIVPSWPELSRVVEDCRSTALTSG